MLIIDGSQGEGGGQILRSSLALSVITGRPFRIDKIRAHRDSPGLRRQHLTAVKAAAQICGGQVQGAAVGARQLTFTPGAVVPGEYHFAIGTAGSTTLVLQTVLPPLLLCSAPSTITLEGGTHNLHAPPFDFLEKAFLPLVNRTGPTVTATLERIGFFPTGGGRFKVEIQPVPALAGFDLRERGEVRHRAALARVAGLARQIADRELAVIESELGWSPGERHVEEHPAEQGPGNILTLEIDSEHVTEVFTGFGQRGRRAEFVAGAAVQEARDYLDSSVPVGTRLADQLLIPLALAGRGSFLTLPPTLHTRTNADVIRQFLEVEVGIEEAGEDQWLVELATHEPVRLHQA